MTSTSFHHSPLSQSSSSTSTPASPLHSPLLPPIQRISPISFHYRDSPSALSISAPSSIPPIFSNPQQQYPVRTRPASPTHTHTRAHHHSQHVPIITPTGGVQTLNMAASTMVNAVAPLRTGITRSTRPPILPLTQSSLSTFNTPRTQEQQFLATFPSPKRPSPRTPPARTPYRHSYDGSAATRERQVSATRRRSTSTFGGRDSSEGDSVADTPLLLSTSPKRRVLSVPTSPANAAETPRRTGHPGARGDAVLNVPARNSSSTAPLKPPRRVGTPILTGLDEGPKDERGVAVPDAASAESNRPAPSHDLNRRATHDAPRREAESFELQYALDQTMDLSDFEVQHPAQSSTGAQGQRPNPMPLSLMADVRLASEVPVTPASDERSSEISQSYRNARSLDLGSVTERVDLMTQIRGKASVSLAAQAEGAM